MNGTELRVLFDRGTFHVPWLDFMDIIIKAMDFRFVPVERNEFEKLKSMGRKVERWELDVHPHIFDHSSPEYYEVLGLIWKAQFYMFIRYDEILEEPGIFLFLRPFSNHLWRGIVASIAVTGISTFIIIFAKNKISPTSSTFGILNAFYHPIEAFTNQYGAEDPDAKSIRITIITGRFVAMFIVPAYSAFLLTYLLYPDIKLPFTDMKGFVEDGSYKIGFSKQSKLESWFIHTEDPWAKLAYEKNALESNEMPKTIFDLSQKICNSKKVIYEEKVANMIPVRCRVVKIPSPIQTFWEGFLLRWKSPYKKIFNRIFKTIFSAGIFNKYDKILDRKRFLHKNFQQAKEIDSVDIRSIGPILQIMSILYLIAVTILLFEYLCQQFSCIFHQARFFGGCIRTVNKHRERPIEKHIDTNHCVLDLSPVLRTFKSAPPNPTVSNQNVFKTSRNVASHIAITKKVKGRTQNPHFRNENEEISVDIKNVISIFQLLLLLYITSIILLFLECLGKRFACF